MTNVHNIAAKQNIKVNCSLRKQLIDGQIFIFSSLNDKEWLKLYSEDGPKSCLRFQKNEFLSVYICVPHWEGIEILHACGRVDSVNARPTRRTRPTSTNPEFSTEPACLHSHKYIRREIHSF